MTREYNCQLPQEKNWTWLVTYGIKKDKDTNTSEKKGQERSQSLRIGSKVANFWSFMKEIIQSARTHKKNNKTKEDFLYGGNSDGD